jgi:hypothetical protein
MEVCDSAAAIAEARGQIDALQRASAPVIHRTPQARFSPQ